MSTFIRLLQLAALGYLDLFLRLVAGPLFHILDLLYNVIALKHFTKDDVFTIKPATICQQMMRVR